MFGPCRYNNHVPVRNYIFIAVNDTFTLSHFKPEKLVIIRMGFHSYFFPHFEVHEYELAVLPRIKHFAKSAIRSYDCFNTDYKSFHQYHLLWLCYFPY